MGQAACLRHAHGISRQALPPAAAPLLKYRPATPACCVHGKPLVHLQTHAQFDNIKSACIACLRSPATSAPDASRWLLPAQGGFDTEILKVLGFYAEQRDSILGEVRCNRQALQPAICLRQHRPWC